MFLKQARDWAFTRPNFSDPNLIDLARRRENDLARQSLDRARVSRNSRRENVLTRRSLDHAENFTISWSRWKLKRNLGCCVSRLSPLSQLWFIEQYPSLTLTMTHAVIPCHRRPLTCRPEARSGHVSIAYGPCIYIWGGYHELQVITGGRPFLYECSVDSARKHNYHGQVQYKCQYLT